MLTVSKWLRFVLAGFNVVLICSCSGQIGLDGESKHGDDPLAIAATGILIEGRRFTLEGHAWRDFMPGPPGAMNRNLITSVAVIAQDTLPFPAGVRANSLWIVNGDTGWKTELSDEDQKATGNKLGVAIRNGPMWKTGDVIRVVVSLVSEDSTFYLKAPPIRIEATY